MGGSAGADEQRVVVTGMGVVTTIGESLSQFCESLKAGRSGITCWKNVDSRVYSKVGGDMSGFDMAGYLERAGSSYSAELSQRALRVLRATPLPAHMAAAAALQAHADAGLPHPALAPERIANVLGGHNLNGNYILQSILGFLDDPEYLDPLYGFVVWDTDVLAKVSEILTLKGPSYTIGNACASGNLALLCGLDLLRTGRADAVVVSAVSQALDPVLLQGWSISNAISWQSFNAEPWRASRPFDARREGFIPSEGAAAVILETLAGARVRGARIHAELLGAAAASDATRLPKPNMEGQVRVMREAFRDARVDAGRVDYINAHATSTPLGDEIEVAAIKAVFGKHAYRIPINSTKSMIGHTLTASALVEFVATILQIENDFVHPTINLEEPDPDLDLDFIPNETRSKTMQLAISNSFGFGGLNATVVVGRAPSS